MNFIGEHRTWLLRIALASVFLFHGIGKLVGPGGVRGFAGMMNLPLVAAWLVTLAEVGGERA
jgi:putative oxidoreductase